MANTQVEVQYVWVCVCACFRPSVLVTVARASVSAAYMLLLWHLSGICAPISGRCNDGYTWTRPSCHRCIGCQRCHSCCASMLERLWQFGLEAFKCNNKTCYNNQVANRTIRTITIIELIGTGVSALMFNTCVCLEEDNISVKTRPEL